MARLSRAVFRAPILRSTAASLILATVLSTLALPAQGADPDNASPFVDIAFGEALQRAQSERKSVLIAFSAPDCAPCGMLDRTTWADPDVREWMAQKTVAMRADAVRHRRLAEMFGVSTGPTIVFADFAGREIDRILGYRDPEAFLAEAGVILSPMPPTQRAERLRELSLGAGGGRRWSHAQKLIAQSRHGEALEEYLWWYDDAEPRRLFEAEVGRIEIARGMIALIGSAPSAASEIRLRRDALEARVREAEATPEDLEIIILFNKALGEPGRALKLYDALRSSGRRSELERILRTRLFDVLVLDSRYDDAAEDRDLRGEVARAFRAQGQREQTALEGLTAEQSIELRGFMRAPFIEHVALYYELFLAMGRAGDAETLARKLIEFDGSAGSHNSLAWAAHRAGLADASHLEFARRAHEMSEGTDARSAYVLASILDDLGRTAEARSLLLESLAAESLSEEGRGSLEYLLGRLVSPEGAPAE